MQWCYSSLAVGRSQPPCTRAVIHRRRRLRCTHRPRHDCSQHRHRHPPCVVTAGVSRPRRWSTALATALGSRPPRSAARSRTPTPQERRSHGARRQSTASRVPVNAVRAVRRTPRIQSTPSSHATRDPTPNPNPNPDPSPSLNPKPKQRHAKKPCTRLLPLLTHSLTHQGTPRSRATAGSSATCRTAGAWTAATCTPSASAGSSGR